MDATVDISETVESLNSTLNIASSHKPLDGELDGELNKFSNDAKFSLKNFSIKQIYLSQWKKMRSWGSFMDTNKMELPTSTVQCSRRFIKNLEFFQSNYLFIIFLLMIYCVLTNPFLLLIIFATFGACYLITIKNRKEPIQIFGYNLSLSHQYIIVAFCSIPFFLIAGAGSVVFWVIGASLFIIGLHAFTYAIETLNIENDQLFEQFPPLSSVESI